MIAIMALGIGIKYEALMKINLQTLLIRGTSSIQKWKHDEYFKYHVQSVE